MNPIDLAAWLSLILEIGFAGTALVDILRRLTAGERVTRQELDAAAERDRQAVARWDAAAVHDRSDVSVPAVIPPITINIPLGKKET